MRPHAEHFEEQERLRRMKLIAEYLEAVTDPSDQLLINFVNYMNVCATIQDRSINIDPALAAARQRLPDQGSSISKTT